jgi:hypothetical protein
VLPLVRKLGAFVRSLVIECSATKRDLTCDNIHSLSMAQQIFIESIPTPMSEPWRSYQVSNSVLPVSFRQVLATVERSPDALGHHLTSAGTLGSSYPIMLVAKTWLADTMVEHEG